MRAERHVADDDGCFGDENIFAELRFFAEKSVKLPGQFVHAVSLTRGGGGTNRKKVSRAGRTAFAVLAAAFLKTNLPSSFSKQYAGQRLSSSLALNS
jgi:hypothetical protein